MTTLEKQVNRVEHGLMTSECCKALTAAPSSKSCPQIYSSPGCPQQQIPILVSQQDQSFSPTREFMSKHLPPRIVSNALVPPWWPNCLGMGSIQIDHHCTKEAQSSIRFKILFSSHSFIGFRHHLPRNSNNRRAFSIQLVQR